MSKYINFSFVILLVLTIGFMNSNAKNILPLSNIKIIIDPGHGGSDPGTVYGNIFEKDLNLIISKYLKSSLERYGAKISMTRDADYDLASPNAIYRKKSDFNNRIKLINEGGFDLYVSIHLNYLSQEQYYGPQVFYKKEDYDFAVLIQQNLNKELLGDRNVKLLPEGIYMYKRLNVPGVLIECGFLSNEEERIKLNSTDYQQLIANVIADSINLYFRK